jgi:DNA polymerase
MEPEREVVEILRYAKGRLKAYEALGFGPIPLPGAGLRTIGQGPKSDPRRGHALKGLDALKSLEDLRAAIGACSLCRLHKGRTNLVFGEGSPRARLVFVGEGPGREEDMEGRPFVGEAGRMLTRIIEAMGLRREDVYICNVVKCRPPNNREPDRQEAETCLPFLRQQLRIIGPEVICALGRVACSGLLGEGFRITAERGKWRDYLGTPLMPTFHPAYLLRYPSAKRQVWQDVQEIMKRLGLEMKRNA